MILRSRLPLSKIAAFWKQQQGLGTSQCRTPLPFLCQQSKEVCSHLHFELQQTAFSGRREFRTSTVVEGYKSKPGTKKWKYVNVHGKEVPKPPKGASLPRFYVPTNVVKQATKGSVFQLSNDETKHALRVLRMSEGDWLEVCDGRGLVVEAQLRGLTYSQQAFATACSDVRKEEWQGPKWEVVAALGGLRGGRAEALVEKISEVGAWSLRPLLTQRSRTIGKWEEKTEVKIVSVEELSDDDELEEEIDFVATGKVGRWERVAVAACKQSLRAHGLILRPPQALMSLVEQTRAGTLTFIAQQNAPPVLDVLKTNMQQIEEATGACMMIIGPEGDFTQEEYKLMIDAGAKPIGLGPNRLRVETAAIAAVTAGVLHWESHKQAKLAQAQVGDSEAASSSLEVAA